MLRSGIRLVLALAGLMAALLCQCGMSAQRGAGGGHTGGGVATGGGLGSVGRSTGVDEKDDLRDYHEALAVQASSQQIAAYSAMLKSTDAAAAEVQGFQERVTKQNGPAGAAGPGEAMEKAVEEARAENKKFLDGFSDAQKSGLREIGKRLIKDDSDLAQAARSLVLEGGNAKAGSESFTVSAQNLERMLATFRTHQVDLGQEMSIGSSPSSDSAFNLASQKNFIRFANQPVAITTVGVISRSKAEGGQNLFALEVSEDLSDLQQNATDVMRAELNQYDRCGERIEIHNAALSPQRSASLVVVQLHYERWSCLHGGFNEMAEGNGTVEVKVTPSVASDGTVRLVAEMGRIDVPGMVGEFLRTGFLGDSLREKVTEALLSAIDRGADLKTLLPPSAQGFTTLHHARFEGTGLGRLTVVLEGEIRVSDEKATLLTGELKRAAGQAPSGPPSPEAAQTVAR